MLTRLAFIIAWAGGAGKSPWAPGSAGSLLAVILAPWCFLPLPLAFRLGLLALLFPLGAWAGGRVARLRGREDPGEVVIDEVVGQWLTLLWLPAASWGELAAGFMLFRVFDIFKPWPISASERWLPGGWGIMLDDVLAGLAAAITLLLGQSLLNYLGQ
jgi:phosphatidylglycerophosphatase A